MYEVRLNKVPIQRTLSLSKKKGSKSCVSKKSIINNSFRNNLDKNRNYPILQRLQLISTERGDVETDATILSNIRFAKEINAKRGVQNEKICSLHDDYSKEDLDMEHNEIIFVHGHGMPGMFLNETSLTFYEAANIIYTKLKLNSNDEKQIEIRMLSCHGGESNIDKVVAPNFPEAMKMMIKKTQDNQDDDKKKNNIKMIVKAIIGSGVSHGNSGISFTPLENDYLYNKWLEKENNTDGIIYLKKVNELSKYVSNEKKKYDQSKNKLKDEYYKNVLDTADKLLPFDFLNKLIASACFEKQLKVATLYVYDSESDILKQDTPQLPSEINSEIEKLEHKESVPADLQSEK